MRRAVSLSQRALLDANQARSRQISAHSTMSLALRIRGPLDLSVLSEAYDLLVERHEVLRSRLVSAAADPQGVAHAEVSAHRPVAIETETDGLSEEALFARWDALPIDPESMPLVRCFVSARGPDEHLFCLVFSHIVADPTSLRIAVRELAQGYEARLQGRTLPPLAMQYGEYAAWQAARVQARLEHDRAAWKSALTGLRPRRYERQVAFVVGREPAPVFATLPLFSRTEVDAIAAWSWRKRSTLSITLLAAFARAIREDADGDDLLVSTVFEQRDHPATRQLLGVFLHPTLVRLRVAEGAPMPWLVEQARSAVLEAYQRAQMPLHEMVSLMPRFLPAALGLTPTWVRFFQYVPMERGAYRFGAATASIAHLGGGPDPRDLVGLYLSVFHAEDGSLHGRLSYDSHDLREDGARRVASDFRDYALELVA